MNEKKIKVLVAYIISNIIVVCMSLWVYFSIGEYITGNDITIHGVYLMTVLTEALVLIIGCVFGCLGLRRSILGTRQEKIIKGSVLKFTIIFILVFVVSIVMQVITVEITTNIMKMANTNEYMKSVFDTMTGPAKLPNGSVVAKNPVVSTIWVIVLQVLGAISTIWFWIYTSQNRKRYRRE